MPATDRLTGSRLGRYEVLERLGAGGMGEVYRARDTDLGREVALKVLPERVASDPERLARFETEARAASALNHPNIVTIHEIGRVAGTTFLAMELIEGSTLRDLLPSQPLLIKRAVELASQAAEGLSRAHAAGIVHRDLKPENIMLTRDGLVKILDFGLAKLAAPGGNAPVDSQAPTTSGGTLPGVLMGTVAYMSPEQARGEAVDHRSDQFSFGAILYEMVTGRRAFAGDSAAQTLTAVIERDPQPLAALNPACPPPLRWIVERCLAKDPRQRYASTADLAAELRSVRDHLDEAITWSSGAHRRPALAALGRWRVALLAGGVLSALALVAYLAHRMGQRDAGLALGEHERVVAVLPLANLSGRPADEYLALGIADVLATSLARVPGVTLVSPSATRAYRGDKRDVALAAREVGASLVVDGALQRLGDRLRTSLSLVQGETSRVLWSDAVDAPAGDVLELQRQLADRLLAALQLSVSAADRRRLERPPTRNTEALADYAQARSFLERPDIEPNVERAIELFRSALAKDSRFAQAHAGLGEAYWERYKATRDAAWTNKATESILEALRLDPDQPQVRLSLAVAYRGTGRIDAALDELRHAIQLQPSSDDAHRLLGEVLAEQGHLEEGVAELQKAIALRPNYWRNHSFLGYAYYVAGRYPDAIPSFRRVTELQPDNARGFQTLGTAYHAMGDTRQALENYRKSIALTPDASAYSNIGTIHYDEGRFERAVLAYRSALELDPNSPALHRNLGDAYLRLRQADEARECYTRAREMAEEMLKVNPKDARTLALLGLCEAKLGRFREARQRAAEAVVLLPEDGEVLYQQAAVHALAGDLDQALATLRQALENGYSPSLASKDEDLAALRRRPEYERLVSMGS